LPSFFYFYFGKANVGSKPGQITQDDKEDMNYILRLKHWQVFLVPILGMYLMNIRVPDNLTVTTVLSVTGGLIYILSVLALGHALYQQLPKQIEFNYRQFVATSIVWLTGQTFYTVLFLQTVEAISMDIFFCLD
jgi:hypothetical protein